MIAKSLAIDPQHQPYLPPIVALSCALIRLGKARYRVLQISSIGISRRLIGVPTCYIYRYRVLQISSIGISRRCFCMMRTQPTLYQSPSVPMQAHILTLPECNCREHSRVTVVSTLVYALFSYPHLASALTSVSDNACKSIYDGHAVYGSKVSMMLMLYMMQK